ncbi:MAG: toll/interleukin-1 receptor domain-containing protein [Anaerolineales bacterium]|nr:toll/interleukin-1 receptor domain-containing protein [Anaerolineales bacterium]
MTETRKLRVFLCHSSQDKPIVRELYQRLNAEGWIDTWLDEEKLRKLVGSLRYEDKSPRCCLNLRFVL